MKRRKVLAILLCLMMMIGIIAACNKDNSTSTNSSAPPADSGSPSASPSASPSSSPSSNVAAASPSGAVIDAGVDTGGGSGKEIDTLSIAIDNDSGVLVPGLVTGGQYLALQSIYEPLWDIDEGGNMIMVLMESYEEIAPDHWRVKLREGVKFSNGVELTADDVVFSLKYWKTIPVNSVRVQSMDEERTYASDKYVVELFMLNGYYYFHDTASSMFMIHCEQGFDEDELNQHPVGTGPYVLKEYVINSHMFLERRDDYWGVKPPVKTLQFRVMAEPSQVANALTTGMIDYAVIALADYDYVSKLPGYNMISRELGGGVGLTFNAGVNGYFNRFSDPEKSLMARYAVYHAINPQAIINLVYEGKGRIMHNPIPDYMFDYKPEYNHMDPAYDIGYNLDKAKELAQASGLSGQTIKIMTNGLPSAVQTAEIVQNMLDQIDVKLEINNYDPATVWAMIYDPLAEYDISVGAGIAPNWRVCDLLLNGIRYSNTLTLPGAFTNNDHYLKICAEMAHEPDPVERVRVTEECLQMYIDNAIGFGLCTYDTAVAVTDQIDLSSLRFSVCTGTPRFNDIKIA